MQHKPVGAPLNPLRKALSGSRTARDAAVARASANVRAIHGDLAAGLVSEMRKLCAVADGSGPLNDAELSSVLAASRVLFNLSGTLGRSDLQSVAVGLQDLVTLMMEQGIHCREPVGVHVRAAALVGPNMPQLEPRMFGQLQRELEAVVNFFKTQPSPCDASCGLCPARPNNDGAALPTP